ncbi:BRCA1-associated RING domain protein 1 [Dirofilaria immitis]|nr:BRCA1-associated RING domain protein 1 [Dirofilaria immitis]
MFASTLNHAEAFLKNICCDQCRQPSDKLQFIGSSCKHVFCWTCINEICDGKSFSLCPQCLLPIELQHVRSAAFANQLFQNLLSLKETLANFVISQFDQQTMLNLFETDEQRRTIEEFCSTQENTKINDYVSCATINTQSKELLSEQQSHVYDEPEKFQFFKEPPKNTFGRTTVKKKFSNSEHGLESRNARSSITIPLTTPSSSHKSPSQRYEYNLNGEDANESDNLGFTALYHAAAHNYSEICKILVENGALINAHGGELCETALHAAVCWHAIDTVKYLLSRGANRRAHNLKGETPMDFIKDDEMRALFGRIVHPVEIVYPSRKFKRHSVFLSTTLPDVKLERGTCFFGNLSKVAVNFETATHLVVRTAENRTAEITVEILEAMLRGQYILTSEWLDACLQANDIVDEEMYEVTAISRDGQLLAQNSCSTARKNFAKMKPELFRGCHFYFCKHKYLPYRDNEIKKLVQLAGGVILGREPKAEEYIESGLRPYHAQGVKNNLIELSGLFAVYMPGQSMPQRIVKQKFINLVTQLHLGNAAGSTTSNSVSGKQKTLITLKLFCSKITFKNVQKFEGPKVFCDQKQIDYYVANVFRTFLYVINFSEYHIFISPKSKNIFWFLEA